VHLADDHAPGTIATIRSQLKAFHDDLGLDTSIFNSTRLKRVCRGITKVHANRKLPPRKQVTFDILESLMPYCNKESLEEMSIRTALCVAFHAFLRAQDFTYEKWGPSNHFTNFTRSSVKFHSTGASLFLPRSKTDQLGRGTVINLPITNKASCPVNNLRRLFTKYPAPDEAPLFGRIQFNSKLMNPLTFSRNFVGRRLHELLLSAGINPIGFTLHSLRRGATQTAANIGLKYNQIQKLGRWTSPAVLKYLKPATALALTPKKQDPRFPRR